MSEILRMAFGALGVNKLRSFLTMSGITIGVFSVIGVMTAVSALRGSIETGLSFLGSNMFQFAKWPTGITGSGTDWEKIMARRRITLAQAQRYASLMKGTSDVICFKAFDNNSAVQATAGGHKTTPGITFGGTNEYFLEANQYAIESGRNFTEGDIDLVRPVCVIGQDIVSKLFPSENPLGKKLKANERTYTVIGTFAAKGTMFGQSEDDIIMVPITRFLMDFGAEQLFGQYRHPGPLPGGLQRDDGSGDRCHAAGARPSARDRTTTLRSTRTIRLLRPSPRSPTSSAAAPSSSARSRSWRPASAS